MAHFELITAILLSVITCLAILQLILNLPKKHESLTPLLDLMKNQLDTMAKDQIEHTVNLKLFMQKNLHEFKENLQKDSQSQRQEFDGRQLENLKLIQDSIQKSMQDIRSQILTTLTGHSDQISKRVDKLTEENNQRLKEISGQVEKRLGEGFEKTTATFADVLKRLALIDEAQKKITALSSNVVRLQEVLSDKRSRGAFGEVQLSSLIRNVLPESGFKLQHTLSNTKRADCILFLPEPTGNIVIDAKFPLESYQKMTSREIGDTDKKLAEQQFRQDIKKHINDISGKYIIEGETADGAMMFIPAEAIFAEIHGHYPDLVEYAQKNRVWLASPTTMMAVLTTARAVLKDADTRKQVHVIQEHLGYLAKDFDRFQKRMDNLASHIQQANTDVQNVHISAKKITSRFEKIERVDLDASDEVN
jgi:DNA recombination protein RmuC